MVWLDRAPSVLAEGEPRPSAVPPRCVAADGEWSIDPGGSGLVIGGGRRRGTALRLPISCGSVFLRDPLHRSAGELWVPLAAGDTVKVVLDDVLALGNGRIEVEVTVLRRHGGLAAASESGRDPELGRFVALTGLAHSERDGDPARPLLRVELTGWCEPELFGAPPAPRSLERGAGRATRVRTQLSLALRPVSR